MEDIIASATSGQVSTAHNTSRLVLIPKLQKLDVYAWSKSSGTPPVSILQSLSLPELTHLSLSHAAEFHCTTSIVIRDLLSSSLSSLHRLKLSADHFSAHDIEQLFFADPGLWTSLKQLQIENASYLIARERAQVLVLQEDTSTNTNILHLLSRSLKSEPSITDSFPALLHLDLALVGASVCGVVDMLECMKTPQFRKHLTRCRLTNTLTDNFRHTSAHIQMEHSRLIRSSIHSISQSA